jgi:hypothetical protein
MNTVPTGSGSGSGSATLLYRQNRFVRGKYKLTAQWQEKELHLLEVCVCMCTGSIGFGPINPYIASSASNHPQIASGGREKMFFVNMYKTRGGTES